MRHSILFILAVALILPASLSAKGMKIGYIRSDMIFKQYKGTKDAQDKYDKEVAGWEQDAAAKEKKIKELEDQMEKQGLLMSGEKKKSMEEEINRLKVEYKEFVYKVFGQGGDAFKKNTEYTKPILKQINAILEEIGKNEGYDFIFDATAGGLVYASNAYDLTDRLVKELNKGAQ
jgi:outer membrane protein